MTTDETRGGDVDGPDHESPTRTRVGDLVPRGTGSSLGEAEGGASSATLTQDQAREVEDGDLGDDVTPEGVAAVRERVARLRPGRSFRALDGRDPLRGRVDRLLAALGPTGFDITYRFDAQERELVRLGLAALAGGAVPRPEWSLEDGALASLLRESLEAEAQSSPRYRVRVPLERLRRMLAWGERLASLSRAGEGP